jgi:hypothetical protein
MVLYEIWDHVIFTPACSVCGVRQYGWQSSPSSVGAGGKVLQGHCFPPRRHRWGVLTLPCSCFGLVDVFGQKPRFRVGTIQWWRLWHCSFVGSFTFGDTALRLVRSSGARRFSKGVLPRNYIWHHRLVQYTIFLGTDQVPPSSPLMVRQQGKFNWNRWSLELTGVVQDVGYCSN